MGGGENGARYHGRLTRSLFFLLAGLFLFLYRNRVSQAEKKKNLLEAKREEHS